MQGRYYHQIFLDYVIQVLHFELGQKAIKSRLNSSIACYHSVQNLLSSPLLYKEAISLPVVLFWCEIWSLTLRKEYNTDSV
jgi:hypothetical protein